jgi:hypothetical protein
MDWIAYGLAPSDVDKSLGRLWLSEKRGEPVVPPCLTLRFGAGEVAVFPCTALNALQQFAGVNLFSLGL